MGLSVVRFRVQAWDSGVQAQGQGFLEFGVLERRGVPACLKLGILI